MARALIVYASHYGQTEKIARRIQRTLEGNGHDVQLESVARLPRELDVAGFDAVLVGGPVHAQHYPAALVRFVRERRQELERVHAVFFSVSLAVASRKHDGRAQMAPVIDKFVQQTGWRPARVELVAGALAYTQYSWLIRFVMRRIAKKEGGDTDTSRDYEYTDWNAVDRFASEVLPAASSRSVQGAAPPL